jgi:ABC-type sugar transport system permease subunit
LTHSLLSSQPAVGDDTGAARADAPGPRTGPGRPDPSPWRRRRRALVPYAFISPFYVLYVAFLLVPTCYAGWLTLHSWSGIGEPTWVGLDNYDRLLNDPSFRGAVGNTMWYVGASVLLICPLALAVAALLNSRGLRARDTFRVMFFLPMVVSPVVVAIAFTMVFDQNFGLANAALRGLLGLPPVNWLGEPVWARVAVVLVLIWRWTGYLVIFFLAGLQGVSQELYEAAECDGAGALRKFWHVSLPGIRPVTAFVAIIVVIGAAQVFEEPYILTRGGPGEATVSVTQFIYRAAFERQEYGYAATAGFVLFVTVFITARLMAHVFGVGREDER